MSDGSYYSLWLNRYTRIQNNRKSMWSFLTQPDVKDEWITRRPKPFQWSIDEIIRHMIGSEIRYIHQSFDPTIIQHQSSVPAQWVGKAFFRFEEGDHVELTDLKAIYNSVEEKTLKLIASPDRTYEKVVKAPWGEEMPISELLESFYDHENYHRGQIYLIINFFRDSPPPDLVKRK
ncbi:MAG: DinB family protein [Candidatus Heimdallarchaeota archaeon]|nr:MAG: DinB family protein [Candidatus Heimdallarchaeota archaeon]